MTWEVKLRTISQEAQTGPFGSQLHAEDYVENGIPIINPSNIINGKLVPDSTIGVSAEKASELRRHTLRNGDLIFARRGELGRAAVVQKENAGWICGTGSIRVRLRPETLHAEFAKFAIQSHRVGWYFQRQSVGSTMGNINTSITLGLPLPRPPMEEQRRIADFLDVETGKIDALIHKKQRLISLMNERIDSRILDQVGKSQLVNPKTGTRVQPLRRMLAKVSRPPVADVDVITAYRDGQVTARGLRRAEGYTLSASTEPQGQNVHVDDVVIHGLDGFAGAIGASEAVGNCSPVYHVCVPAAGGDPKFFGRLLRLLALQGYLGNFATSTRERAVDFRNWDLFGRIPLPVISNGEQFEIGKLITNVGPIKDAIERSKILAYERRQALITAAVTGQFDVSTASGRGVTE